MIHKEASELVGRRMFGLNGPFPKGCWLWTLPGSSYSFLPSFTTDIDSSKIMKKLANDGFAVNIRVAGNGATAQITKGDNSWSSTSASWNEALLLATHDVLALK